MTDRSRFVRRGRWLTWAAVWALLAGGPVPAVELGRLRSLARPFRGAPDQGRPPQAPCSGAVERLGDEITWLERHIDLHGSIVAKQPDVWGQGRLTRFRDEYEEQMRRQLGQFSARTNAALRRSDQSFLGMALALQAAAGNRPGSRAVPVPAPGSSVVNQIQGWLPTTNESAGRSDPVVIARTEPFGGPAAPPGFRFDDDAIALEPTLHLDQLSRYLHHLAQLRRINEGDDSADAPGYALTLVRLPVSILPGERTARGHGAEITVSIEPCLGDDLLPVTFRNLVVNDVVDTVAPALTWCINDPDCLAWAETIARGAAADAPETTRQGVRDAARALAARLPTIVPAAAPATKTRRARLPLPSSQLADVAGIEQVALLVREARAALASHPTADPCVDYLDVRGYLAEELEAAYDLMTLESQRPVWGEMPAWNLAALVRGRQTRQVAALRCRFLAGLGAAEAADEPDLVLPPAAAAAVGPCCDHEQPLTPVCRTTTAVLAWGILVESALLDERLVTDMREAASARGLPAAAAAEAGPFYGPDPSPQARQAFNDYVRCRWPIRVFALDPVVEEQNVDDSYARRRELQIAMAVAAASGRVGAQALTRFTRRQELDLATVALNRTAVGFSHGDDTFGWRFYPRVQTPPDRGALGALADTVCPPDDLAQRRLEPGQRECTAIVVLPSFVPWVTLDVRANWFSLAHPGTTEQTMKQALLLSRSLQAVRAGAAACHAGGDRYTGAAVRGLLRRIDQLERELPLQTLQAQVPHENTAGGFELFNAGTTALAPELVGWYGAPGIDPAAGTTLFLIGKGFSIHDTQVIAGGRPAPFRLLSREVLRVDVPAGVLTIAPPCPAAGHARRGGPGVVPVAASEPLPAPDEPPARAEPAPMEPAAPLHPHAVDCGRREVVDIHLATPAGVSGHLLVPVARRRVAEAVDVPALEPATTLGLTFSVARVAGARLEAARVDEFFTTDRDEIAIAVPASFIPPPRAELRLVLRDEASGATAAVFSFPEPFFDARGGRYVIAGGALRNLVGDTSRPAPDKTLRGALKPWLDDQLARGALAEDGDAATFALTATIVAAQQELPVAGTIVVHVQRRGRTVTEPRPAADAPAAPDVAP